MEDDVAVVDQLGEHRLVADRVDRVVEARVFGELLDVVDAAGREIVDDEDLVAARDAGVGEMRADESRAAGDENFQF